MLVALSCGVLAWRAFNANYLSDDAFITLRYARNWFDGNGLVFNPGEHVEGFTNFLLVVLEVGLHRLGLEWPSAARLVSFVSAEGCLLLTYRLASGWLPRRTWLAAGSVAGVALNPYFAAWALGGLEAPLYGLWLLAAALVLESSDPSTRSWVRFGLVAALLALTRPEGLMVAVALAAIRLGWPRPGSARWAAAAPALLIVLGVLLPLEVARLAYYGDVLPNTFYAKSAFSPRHLQRGLQYLWGFAQSPGAAVILPFIAWGVARQLRARSPAAVALVASVAVVIAEGGDGLPMYRFLVPLVPLAAACASVGLDRAFEGPFLPRAIALNAFVLALVLAPVPANDHCLSDFQYQRDVEGPLWARVGQWLHQHLPAGTTLAAVPAGALGFYSELPLIDLVGLTDRTIAHTPLPSLGSGLAGHEKTNGAYVLSRHPEVLLLGNIDVSDRPELADGRLDSWSNDAIYGRERDIVSDPRFQTEYEATAFPLGNGEFLHAFVRCHPNSGSRWTQ